MSVGTGPEVQLAAAVFASGGGSNFQALLDHAPPQPRFRIRLLVSDRDGIGALQRARDGGIPTRVVPTRDRTGAEVAAETLAVLEEHGVEVIFLAGYLKLLPRTVVERYRRRILNIHPALLPGFGGKGMWGHHVHEAVIASGVRVSGPTVHLVDEEYDRGMIVAQWPVPVLAGDTPDTLAARVLKVEHRLYPMAADHVCAALGQGRDPTPLALPGEGYALVPSLPPGGLAP